MTASSPRRADHEIDPLFLERWSPRAFDGTAVPEAALHAMLEAARWAPSSYNAQPWRFLYARRDTAHWGRFLDLLVPFNQGWAQHAGALVCFVSKSTMRVAGKDEEAPSHSHSFDAGAAWMAFALQARRLGYDAHGMTGFDIDGTYAALRVPAGHRVEMMAAVGRRGDPATLPEALRTREAPNERVKLAETAFEGGFPEAP